MKRTPSQERVLRLLKTLNRALSAQEIYFELHRHQQKIGLATVYRSLEGLKKEGAIQERKLASGESLYDSIHRDQHYLTCVHCSESIPLESCPFHDHELEGTFAQSHQFKVYYHTLEFFGLCLRCQEKMID